MTLKLWLSIVMMCFMFFGVPEEQRVEIVTKDGQTIFLEPGEVMSISADGKVSVIYIGHSEDLDGEWEEIEIEEGET